MSSALQFVKFLVVGCIGLLVLLGVTYVLTEFIHLWYFWAYGIATLCSWTSIFLLNSLFTFAGHSKERYAARYAAFLVMYLGAFVINAGLVYALTSLLQVYYLVSITIATAVTTLITFTINKRLIFTYGNKDQSR